MHEMPEYVKTADVEDLQGENTAGSHYAALQPTPRLPCHTKASTWLSYAYLLSQKDRIRDTDFHKFSSRIEKYARYWGIEDDILKIRADLSEFEKQAAEASERYPLRNSAEISQAASWLAEQLTRDAPSIVFQDRVKLAARLLDAGVCEYPEFYAVSCRRGCYDGNKVANLLEEKVDTYPQLKAAIEACRGFSPEEMQEQHRTLAEICDALGVFDNPSEVKLAVNTLEPVVHLRNGMTLKQSELAKVHSVALDKVAEMHVCKPEMGAKLASLATTPDEVFNELVDDIVRAGVDIEVLPKFEAVSIFAV